MQFGQPARGGVRARAIEAARSRLAAQDPEGAAKALEFDIEEFLQKNFRELTEQEIDDVLRRLERKYSRYLDDSLASRINARAGDPDGVLVDDL